MTRKEFKDWYEQPFFGEALEETKMLNFTNCKETLFSDGKSYKDVWYKDYIIWKLLQ